MNSKELKLKAERLLTQPLSISKKEALEIYELTIKMLNLGHIRVAEKIDNLWTVNTWIKQVIILGFKYGELIEISERQFQNYYDKDTLFLKQLSLINKIRLVPGGSSIRNGSYLSPGTIVMPPSYINVGAYIDEGVLVDSHVLIGSCAQIGKNVHISAAAQIGGVLEPIGASPVIIEDDVFIGGNSGIYDGTIIQQGAVIGTGVWLNGSMRVFDNIQNRFIEKTNNHPLIIPKNAVVIPGTRPLLSEFGRAEQIQVYCPVIIKYRDTKTDHNISLESALRD